MVAKIDGTVLGEIPPAHWPTDDEAEEFLAWAHAVDREIGGMFDGAADVAAFAAEVWS